jgi:rfaE bifunctional protein nucleotidyltransferase chain/domain
MTTVLAHGCFDLLHLGHIRHLKEAKSLGDHLVVSVTADQFVNKGRGRPHFSTKLRCEALLALDMVDEVVVNEAPTAVEVIRRIKPDVYVKGIDYAGSDDGALAMERQAVEAHGGRLHITASRKWSATNLLHSLRYSDDAIAYLEELRRRNALGQIINAFHEAHRKHIAFVGETITDEYRYVRPLAKPSKEFILATVADSTECFLGGIVAASAHGEWGICEVVTSPGITKTRFVDADFSRKLFEVYSARQVELDATQRTLYRNLLKVVMKRAEIVIVADFGHGLLGEQEREILADAKYLAVAAQTNAGNQGFNPVTKYSRANYVCIDEPEARLALGEPTAPLNELIKPLASKLNAQCAVITRGRHGALTWGDGRVEHVPAFIDGGVDTMGAGDAFLAISAPLLAVGLPVDLAAFVGNVAGGLQTLVVGHRQHVSTQDVIKNLEWLLR